jgi:hypothetical protein
MKTRLPQPEETSGAIAALLAVCALVCGLFGFGFYKLMQPVQFTNPGVAAYKLPPGTVITYPSAAQFTYNQPATLLPATTGVASLVEGYCRRKTVISVIWGDRS